MLKVALLLLVASLLPATQLKPTSAGLIGAGSQEELVPTQNVRQILDKVKRDVELELGQKFDSLQAYRFRGQVVAGYLYYISAIGTKDEEKTYVHLKVLDRPWADGLQLVGVKVQPALESPITFADYATTLRSSNGAKFKRD